MLSSACDTTLSTWPAVVGRGAEARGDHVEIAAFEIPKGVQASLAHLRTGTVTRLDGRIDRLDLGMRDEGRNAAEMRATSRVTAVTSSRESARARNASWHR